MSEVMEIEFGVVNKIGLMATLILTWFLVHQIS